MPAPAMTTTFWLLVNTLRSLSSSGCCSGPTSLLRRSKYPEVRSLEILLLLLGGGPSLSVFVPESIPSGVGLPVCEVDCEEGGEGRYTPLNCE